MRNAKVDSLRDAAVIVIGAGLAGLWAGIQLTRARIPFAIVEKTGEVGGTWKVNRYPGVAVDVNAFSYSYRGVPYFAWTRAFAPGADVAAYAEHLADAFSLRDKIHFHTEVRKATFDERRHLWRLSLASGRELTCRFLIHAPGGLTQPKLPSIPGLATFAGPKMHTAEWRDDIDLTARRVAVIGTGASAVQVVPSIAPTVAHLTVFQRTPIWVAPKLDFAITPRLRKLYERVPRAFDVTRIVTALPSSIFFRLGTIHAERLPFLQRGAEAWCRRHLAKQVRDPMLREKLTPRYGFGCKRPVVSNDYLRTFNRPNVSLVTRAIERIEQDGIVTTDGVRHALDVLVLATGFKVFELGNAPPYPITGLGGLELGRFWHENRYQAYEACSVPQWPNMFFLTGPYGLGGRSYLAMVEAATRHALRVIGAARARGATYVAVRQKAHEAYFADVLRRQKHAVYFNGTCAGSNSYYFDHHGDAPAMRPHLGFEIELHSRFSPLDDYEFRTLASSRTDMNADRALTARA